MNSPEDKITKWFASQAELAPDEFPIGIGDDMAMMRIAKETNLLVTTDMLLDGVHFDSTKTSLEKIGAKAASVSLSDCAAMATIPMACVCSVGLPAEAKSQQLKEIHAGVTGAIEKFGCKLIGGDITSWKNDANGKLVINIAMMSRPAGIEPVRRSGAKAGDIICVTGTLGGSLAGKHLDFVPRVNEAVEIATMVKINAMMDISDGLSCDLARICDQSNTGAIVDAELIPISSAAKKTDDPLKAALNDGEDFELLFTLSNENYQTLKKNKIKTAIKITKIGIITDGGLVQLKTKKSKLIPLEPKGYDHLFK